MVENLFERVENLYLSSLKRAGLEVPSRDEDERVVQRYQNQRKYQINFEKNIDLVDGQESEIYSIMFQIVGESKNYFSFYVDEKFRKVRFYCSEYDEVEDFVKKSDFETKYSHFHDNDLDCVDSFDFEKMVYTLVDCFVNSFKDRDDWNEVRDLRQTSLF
jgi:hypothetical protein